MPKKLKIKVKKIVTNFKFAENEKKSQNFTQKIFFRKLEVVRFDGQKKIKKILRKIKIKVMKNQIFLLEFS